jgi:glycosyltransferase involved in cell wall biosynthesis
MKIAYISSPSYLDTLVPLLNSVAAFHHIVLYLISQGAESGNEAAIDNGVTYGPVGEALVDQRARFETRVVDVYRLSAKSPRSWFAALKMISEIKAEGFEICQVQIFLTQFLPLLIGRRFSIVADVHDPFPHVGEHNSVFLLPRLRLFLRSCDQVILHNISQSKKFSAYYHLPPEKVHVIPFGAVDNSHQTPETMEEDHAVLFFGRISPYKGVQILVEAWKTIREILSDARLMIVGDGDFGFDVSPLREDERVELCNRRVGGDELVGFLRRCSLVVLPYIEASQSGVLLTALSFGKPVVITEVGGLTEMVEHGVTGLVVPPNDPVSIARAVIELLSNRDFRRSVRRNIIHRVRSLPSWAEVAEITNDIYAHRRRE